jgi:hypothetical protein
MYASTPHHSPCNFRDEERFVVEVSFRAFLPRAGGREMGYSIEWGKEEKAFAFDLILNSNDEDDQIDFRNKVLAP